MGNVVTDASKMMVIEQRINKLTYVLENAIIAHLTMNPDVPYTFEELAQAHTTCATAALRNSSRMSCRIDDEED